MISSQFMESSFLNSSILLFYSFLGIFDCIIQLFPIIDVTWVFKKSSILIGSVLCLNTTLFKSLNKLSDVALDSVTLPYLKYGVITADQQGNNLQKLQSFLAMVGSYCILS